MLLTLLFHRIEPADPAFLEANLSFLAKNFPLLLPGDRITPFKTSLQLTFDDGYFDFYHYIFPLLEKLNIKALLAVPAGYILDRSALPSEKRLLKLKSDPFKTKNKDAFCSFAELKEMAQTGLVEIASHSFSHQSLIHPDANLEQEIIFSKKLLEEKLDQPIRCFVYPYGHFNREVQALVKKHYQHALRIGSAINFSWQSFSGLHYRQNVKNFYFLKSHLKKRRYLPYVGYYLLNTLRGR